MTININSSAQVANVSEISKSNNFHSNKAWLWQNCDQKFQMPYIAGYLWAVLLVYINSSVQDCGNSSALVMELPKSCAKPYILYWIGFLLVACVWQYITWVCWSKYLFLWEYEDKHLRCLGLMATGPVSWMSYIWNHEDGTIHLTFIKHLIIKNYHL